jgi:predicted secreted protein
MTVALKAVVPSHTITSAPENKPTEASPDEAASLLLPPASEAGLPILGRLHLLMIKANQQSREADRKAEEQFEAEERAHDAARVKEMRDKADSAFVTGFVSAAIQLGSGTASAMAAGSSLSKMVKHDLAARQAEKARLALDKLDVEDRKAWLSAPRGLCRANVASEEAKRAADRAAECAKMVDAAGKALDGARTAIDAGGKSLSGHADARIAEHESAARAARRAADRLKSEQDAAKQAEARTMQLAAEIEQAHQQSLRAALVRA